MLPHALTVGIFFYMCVKLVKYHLNKQFVEQQIIRFTLNCVVGTIGYVCNIVMFDYPVLSDNPHQKCIHCNKLQLVFGI